MLLKSPSGSTCPYYYMGNELHPLHYGSYFNDKKNLFKIIKEEEEFILKSSGINNRLIWIDLYETTLDDEVINFLIEHFCTINHKILKLCLIGCSSKTQKKITSEIKKKDINLVNKVKYFSEPEKGKMWLVGKFYV